MVTMNISLPQTMRNAIEDRLEGSLYANASDYIRDLVRRDLNDAAPKWMLDAIEQAELEPVEDKDFDRHAFLAELMAETADA